MAQTNYHFNPITFEFTYESDARLDYLETEKQGIDVYLVPGKATAIATPATGVEQVAVFNIGLQSWSVEVDNRGTWYDPTNGNAEYIEDIGVAHTPGFVSTPPPGSGYEWDGAQWIRTLALAKSEKQREINAAYELQQTTTVVAAEGATWTIKGTDLAIAQNLYFFKKTFGAGDYDFPDVDLNIITLNDPASQSMIQVRGNAWLPMYANLITKTRDIKVAADVATVDAITW